MARRERVKKRAGRESRSIEFKERFDPSQLGDWCELIKDVVSIANSGGGSITVGVKGDGSPSGWNPGPLLGIDPAQMVDKIARYTGEQFADFEIVRAQRRSQDVAEIRVGATEFPMVFVRPGTYEVALPSGTKKQERVFSAGTVYFRHGATSEPANSHDLRFAFERRLAAERKAILANVWKVTHLRAGHEVRVVPARMVAPSDPAASPIRLVADPSVSAVRGLDPNKTHPYRQTEVVRALNEKLKGKRAVNAYDVLCIRRVYRIDEKKSHFCYKPMFGSAQYSGAFVEWILGEYAKNPRFLDEARAAYRRLPLKER